MHVCVYVYVCVCVTCVPRTCAESLTGMDTQAVWRGYSTRAVVPALLMHAHRVCGIMRRQRARLLRQVSSLYPVLSGFLFWVYLTLCCITISCCVSLNALACYSRCPDISFFSTPLSKPHEAHNHTRCGITHTRMPARQAEVKCLPTPLRARNFSAHLH